MTATPARREASVAPPIARSGSGEPAIASTRPTAGELALVPAFCSVCGDQPSEPAAMTEDFELRTSAHTFLTLCCGSCGSMFLALAPSEAALDLIFPPAAQARRAPAWEGVSAGGVRVLDLGPWVSAEQLRRVLPEGIQYDLAHLDLTLECTADPLAMLEAVRAALRPGGYAMALLNNLRSPAFRWFGGRHWGGYDAPRQRRVLSQEGLARLAKAAGFELAGMTGVAAAGPWVRSLHRWCTDWGAPAWLARRFSTQALVAPALFHVIDAVFRPSGRSTFVVATLRRRDAGPR